MLSVLAHLNQSAYNKLNKDIHWFSPFKSVHLPLWWMTVEIILDYQVPCNWILLQTGWPRSRLLSWTELKIIAISDVAPGGEFGQSESQIYLFGTRNLVAGRHCWTSQLSTTIQLSPRLVLFRGTSLSASPWAKSRLRSEKAPHVPPRAMTWFQTKIEC